VFHRHGFQAGPQSGHHLREFLDGEPVAAAVAADQNTEAVLGSFGAGFSQGVASADRME
jgi:hypothetical protein